MSFAAFVTSPDLKFDGQRMSLIGSRTSSNPPCPPPLSWWSWTLGGIPALSPAHALGCLDNECHVLPLQTYAPWAGRLVASCPSYILVVVLVVMMVVMLVVMLDVMLVAMLVVFLVWTIRQKKRGRGVVGDAWRLITTHDSTQKTT